MKIWIIEISDFLPKVDQGNRLYRAGMLANAFAQKGHQIIWWSSTFNHQRRCHRFDNSTTVTIKNGYQLRLLHGPGYKKSISLKRWWHNKKVAKEFAREVDDIKKEEQPDVIYTCLPTLEVSEKAVLYGLRNRIPVVVDIRELLPDNYLTVFPKFFRRIIHRVLKREFLRAYKILHYSTAVFASSPSYLDWGIKVGKRKERPYDKWFPLGSVANDQIKKIPEKSESIRLPNGILLPNNCLLITFVGTFTSHYDYDTVLKIANDFYKSGQKQVHFLFVGDGDKAPFLKKQSKNLNNVHLPGWCDKVLIGHILSISSIGLAPYLMEIQPALPNKPFEYMAAGLPILSSLSGELENIIKEESIGLQYCGGDSDDFKKKIMWFLAHPSEMKEMGKKAKKIFHQKYDANTVYSDIVKHIEKIASHKE